MKKSIDRVGAVWNDAWFEPDTALNLAIVRIIVATHALWVMLSRDFPAISGYPEVWTHVSRFRQWRYLLFPGHPDFEYFLQGIAIIALIGAISGVYPRVSCFVGGLLVYHLAPLETIIYTSAPLGRGSTIAPVALLILAFARSGDTLVLFPKRKNPAASTSVAYGWPRRLIWLLVSQIYLFSAWAKMVDTGPGWGSAENMRLWFLSYWFYDDINIWRSLNYWLSEQPWLLGAMGFGVVVFEWVFIAAVFSRYARRVLVPVAFMFQISVGLTLGFFVNEALLVVLFVNWDWVFRRLSVSEVGRVFAKGRATPAAQD